MARLTWAMAVVVGFTMGCDGSVMVGAGEPAALPREPNGPNQVPSLSQPDPMNPTDPCAGAPAEPGPAPIRRLSNAEYANTVRDLLGETQAPVNDFEIEPVVHGFFNNAYTQAVSQLQATKYMDAAELIASRVDVSKLWPCTPTASNIAACSKQLVEQLGSRAFRRPLNTDEVTRYLTVFQAGTANGGDFTNGARVLVRGLLQSPYFLYRPELPNEGTAGQVVRIGSYEMASRLSYLYWLSMPDAALFDAAAQGKLSSPADIEAQARRLLADPKAKAMVSEFFAELLKLRRFDDVKKSAALVPNFDAMRPLLKQELEQFVTHTFWEQGTPSALLSSTTTYANKTLAGYYGISGPTGDVFVATPVGTGRAGLLTTGAFLSMSGSEELTSPTQRGKFIRENVLCTEMPEPPPDVNGFKGAVDPTATTRERYSQHVSDAACAGCHTLMDPLGFGLEGFDAAGRRRTTENGKPVNASGSITGLAQGPVAFVDGFDMANKLGSAPEASACFGRHWAHFAFGRSATPAEACSLQSLDRRFAASGYDMRELLVLLTQTDAFQYQRVQ